MSSGGDPDDSPRPPAKPVPRRDGGPSGGGNPPPGPCNIVVDTTVNSPDRAVLATLRPGDVLNVEYRQGPPIQLIARTANGAVLGSLTPPSLPQIVQCSREGYQYSAVVIEIRGGACSVQIQPR
jgi:hypothetical protein